MEKRAYPPGEQGRGRRRRLRTTDYGAQLREKQKARRIYGVNERQFRRYFQQAEKMRGVTAHNLLQLLERRLDTVVYRMGFASSRAQARLMIVHAHFMVNEKRVDIPSYLVRADDRVSVRERSRNIPVIKGAVETSLRSGLPTWIAREEESLTGTFLRLPALEEISIPVKEQLIVDLYSR